MVSYLDRLYARFANRKRFFSRGWGELSMLKELVSGSLPRVREERDIEISWEREFQEGGVLIRQGVFQSPVDESLLAPGCEKAYVEWVMPADAHFPPVTLHFAATGDEGFLRRRIAFALPLARLGISSMILENPYYGARRPKNQDGKYLLYVSDLWKMGRMAAEEGLALSRWLIKEGYELQVACGVSMGGHIAAKVANFSSQPIGCVAFIAPHSAEAVYLEGLLKNYVAWDVLEKEWREKLPAGQFFREVLSKTDIREVPPSHPMEKAVIIGALNDAYIPRKSVLILHRHWPDAKLRWVPGGHVSAFIRHRKTMIDALIEVIRELGG